jgi:hypothetical protein
MAMLAKGRFRLMKIIRRIGIVVCKASPFLEEEAGNAAIMK